MSNEEALKLKLGDFIICRNNTRIHHTKGLRLNKIYRVNCLALATEHRIRNNIPFIGINDINSRKKNYFFQHPEDFDVCNTELAKLLYT